MASRCPARGLAAIALVCSACVPELEVPAAARVGCRGDGDCPAGFICAASLGRCTPIGARDTVAPALQGAVAPEPTRGNAGTVFRLHFRVSETLAEAPEITARLGAETAARTVAFARESGEGPDYVFAWTARETDPEGTGTVSIALLDEGGNRATVPGGSFVLDLTPPALVPGSGSALPAIAKAGSRVAIEFAVRDDQSTPAWVLAGGRRAEQVGQDQTRYTFQYVVAPDDPEGPLEAVAHLVDGAGNEADVPVAAVEVDRTAPLPTESTELPQRPLRAGEAVRLVLGFSELVGDGPSGPDAGASALSVRMDREGASIVLERTSLASGLWSPKWAFLHTIENTDGGHWTLRLLGVSDRAGNALAETTLGAIDVDAAAPAFAAGPSPERIGHFKADDVVRVRFTPDEDAQAEVALSVGGVDVGMTRESAQSGFSHVYAHRVVSGDPQGDAELVVRLTDAAGNAGDAWRAGGIAVDTEAPALWQLQVAPGPLLAARTSLVATAVADEALADAQLESDPPLAFGPAVLSGTQALWSYLVSPSDASREYVLTARVTDRAGNRSGAAGATVRFDTQAPQALDVVLQGSPAREGGLLLVAFDVSEPLADMPTVTVGGAAMDLDGATDLHFEFSRRARAADGSGTRDVAVVMRDPAGNETNTLLGRMVFDFHAPVLAAADVRVSPASPVGLGAALSVTVSAPETLAGARLEAAPELDFGAAVISGRTALWSRLVTAQDPTGPRTLTVRVTDLAGNESNPVIATVALDTVVPALSAVVVEGSPARAETTVRVAFDVSETLATARVLLGTLPMDPFSASGRHREFTHLAAPPDGEGAREVIAEATDAAGNELRQVLGTVVLDFTAPRLLASDVTVSPDSPVPVGAGLSVSVASDEVLASATLAASPVLPASRALDLGTAILSGGTALWGRVVTVADASGEYSLKVEIADAAGNLSSLEIPAALELDTVRPEVSNARLSGSPAREDATVSLEFDVSEDLGAEPTATVGAAAMTRDAARSQGRHFAFVHAAKRDEHSGSKPAGIVVTDRAGNSTTAFPGVVVYDFEPPVLGPADVRIAPASPVGLGANLSVSATADEPLGAATLHVEPSLPMGDALLSGRTALWSHIVGASDRSESHAFSVTVADLAGNETAVPDTAVLLDTAAPEVLPGAVVEGSPAKEGATVVASFAISETLPGAPEVLVGSVPMALDEDESAGNSFSFSHVAALSEGSGAKDVVVRLSDAAGNATATTLGRVVYDFRAPAIVAVVVEPESPVGVGASLRIVATADEPLGPGATLSAGGLAMGSALTSGRSAIWNHVVTTADAGTSHDLVVSIEDLAGNATSETRTAAFTLDTSIPTLSGAPAVAPALVKAGQQVVAVFDSSEAMTVEPVATVGAAAMTKDPASTATHFVFRYTTTGTEGSGSRPVVATLADAAGNASTATLGAVVFDFVPPHIVGVSVEPFSPIGVGANLRVVATADEPLGPAATLTAGALETGSPVISGRSAIWNHVVTTSDTAGAYDLSVAVQDLAGNAATGASTDAFTLDTSIPTVVPMVSGEPAVAPTLVKAGQEVVATFDSSETMTVEPLATVGAAAMTKDPASSATHFVLRYTTTGTEGSGTKPVVVTLADAAGNASTTTLGGVVFDFVPPNVLAVSVEPLSPIGVDANLRVVATADEPLGQAATLTAGALDMGSPIISGRSAIWSHVVTTSDPGGAFDLSVTVEDLAGNANSDSATDAFTLDTTIPVVLPGASVGPSPLMAAKDVVATFDTSETMTLAPAVTVGGLDMTNDDASTGTHFVFRYRTLGSEGSGTKPVVATLADSAGNRTTTALGSVVFDFDPPVLASVGATPSVAGIGVVLTVRVLAEEALSDADPLTVQTPPGIVFRPPVVAGPVVTWTHNVVSTSGNGPLAVTFTLRDVAGNATSLAVPSIAVLDTNAPGIASVPAPVLPTGPLRSGVRNEVKFSVSETLSEAPLVQLNGAVFVQQSPVGPHQHRFWRTVSDATEVEGTFPVLVRLVDAAGNRTTTSLGTVTLDFTPPAVASSSVAYVAAASNPLGVVEAATVGTTVVVTVLADEPLGASPVPSLDLVYGTAVSVACTAAALPGGGTFSCPVRNPTGTSATYTCQGRVTWADVAGNTRNNWLFSPGVLVKTSAGSLSVNQDAVTFLRSPIGNRSTEPLGTQYTVPAGPVFELSPPEPLTDIATLAAGTFLFGSSDPKRLRAWADGSKASLMGTLQPQSDGTWPRAQLARADTPTAYVTGLDAAGNESSAIKIRTTEFVAPTGEPDSGASPHDLTLSRFAGVPRTLDPLVASAAERSRVAQPDRNSVRAVASEVWRERPLLSAQPSERWGHAAAWDSARGRVVLFGGTVESGSVYRPTGDTWEWDGRVWLDRGASGEPMARTHHAMAYDARRDRVVLFGGDSLGDTWEWDGTTWNGLNPSVRPPNRGQHAMAFDAARGEVVLFGGRSGSAQQDTWLWNGTMWSRRAPTNVPPRRFGHAMAYDWRRERVVLFGGMGESGSPLQDLWEWDGADWLARTPSGPPPRRTGHAMAYDSNRGRTVLFGGTDADDACLSDTWEWTGTTWYQRSPDDAPYRRAEHAMVWDAVSGHVMLFGGSDTRQRHGDWWEWTGSNWVKRSATGTEPSARERHAMVFDDKRDVTLLFGGYAGTGMETRGDTWLWNGTSWTQRVFGTGSAPTARYGHAMAFNDDTDIAWLYGGEDGVGVLSDTWQWDGASWSKVAVPGPTARARSAMVYDDLRNRLVVFGGKGSGSSVWYSTWEFNSSTLTWANIGPSTHPSARWGHAMAYDAYRRRSVLFGGVDGSYDSLGDTWEWDGTTWEQKTPGTSPGARVGHAMAYDSTRRRVVLFGGAPDLGTDPRRDLWEWDGTDWVEKSLPEPRPAARAYTATTYDTARKRLVLFAGDGITTNWGDTWELDASSSRTPAVQFDVSAFGRIAASWTTGLRVRAHCGGVFSPYAAADTGASLFGWSLGGPSAAPGAWVALASNGAGVAASSPWLAWPPAALMDWKAADAAEALRFVTDRDLRLSFQCRPDGSSGVSASEAAVAVDYAEVRLRYRAP